MRGLQLIRANERPKKNAPDGTEPQTDKHTSGNRNSITESAKRGRFSEKSQFS